MTRPAHAGHRQEKTMASSLVQEITAELENKKVQAQVGRFVRLFVIAFGAQLAAAGTGDLTRDALISLGVGAAETAYRQLSPTVPWGRVLSALHRKAPAVPAGPAVVPPAGPGAGSPPAK
jgi:hypothetical protein